MIEVLVSIVVMAFGMLGVAALQLSAVHNSQSSMERSMATVQAYSILDAMRSNALAARSGDYDLPEEEGCAIPSGSSLARRDLQVWMSSLKRTLGNSVCASVKCLEHWCTVEIQWDGLPEPKRQIVGTKVWKSG